MTHMELLGNFTATTVIYAAYGALAARPGSI